MRSAVTISLVEQARQGPFVFHGDLAGAARQAADLGFDGIEVFAPGPDAVPRETLAGLLRETGLVLAAVGTGAGWLVEGWTLTSADESVRRQAVGFIRSMIDFGGPHGAPAIIGSMQGRWGGGAGRDQALDWLRDALDDLGRHAGRYGVPLLFEPLNRYETNMCTTLEAGLDLLATLESGHVRLLADLFHMNIEEVDAAAALRAAGSAIGHVHFVDSTRRPVGGGHLDIRPMIASLREIGYQGFLSAEALPWPDSRRAAEQTMNAFRYFAG